MEIRSFRRVTSLLVSLLFLAGCSQEETELNVSLEHQPPIPVTVATVTEQSAPNQLELVGTVRALHQAEISAKISGNIIAMHVELGSPFKKDQLLIELGADEIHAQLKQAKAQLEQAKRNLKREEKLLQRDAATPERVKSLRDALRIAEAAFLESQSMLNYTRVPAPFDGIVTRKFANTGDLATPGKPLLQIESEKQLQVETDIPEALAHTIHLGDELTAYIPAVQTEVTGTVTEISPTTDPASRTTPIKMVIESQPHIRSGQFARVTLPKDENLTLVIPKTAIVAYGQLERVFVAKDNKASLRLVRSGSYISSSAKNQLVEILSGLEAGERIITSGHGSLQSGQPIAIQ